MFVLLSCLRSLLLLRSVARTDASLAVLVRMSAEDQAMAKRKREDETRETEKIQKPRGIIDELVVYINGSTYPMVSDHKLKQLLAENGARLSTHLGRRQVTHVILGKPCGRVGSGAGGGLAGGKLEKEIRRIGGCGVKYVGVEWYGPSSVPCSLFFFNSMLITFLLTTGFLKVSRLGKD